MEELEVEIFSREDIKPSSPTPSHLRTFKHSILDQVNPFHYAPVVVFYTSHNPSEFPKRLELLKQSLSEILTNFYPLGGKIKDKFSIDCNDEGMDRKNCWASRSCPMQKISNQHWGYILKEGNWITKRFLFTNLAIATLKAQILAKSLGDPLKNHPTRIQIVSALLWKCFMVASKAQFGTQRPSLVTHTVNLRQVMEKSLDPENSIGNFLWFCTSEHTGEHELSLDKLVSKLKNSIQQVDKDLVARFRRYEDASSIVEDDVRNLCSKTQGEAFETLGFSSWYNFGVYDSDFGWGKPIWGSPIGLRNTLVCMNTIILIQTRFRDGIEAWVTLEEEKMKHFESCSDLLTYATLDPSPLTMGSTGSNSKL
ncbi:hypothetical protein PIB30_002590 [Stylosanthes scabra]|uniref:Vinorine synthase-like n=1 Tax=Stylosanthes scabra TaxID=79078 RepID=A0ABU6Z1T8_9FABA|nr:hypothetical protein [Stylosanthes scabra]